MRTSKGNSFSELMNVRVEQSMLFLGFKVPMELGDFDKEKVEKVIAHMNDLMIHEKRGAGVYEKALLQVEHHREQLQKAYIKILETYDASTRPTTRSSPIDNARRKMLESMLLMNDRGNMLRQFCGNYLDADDFVLPDEAVTLIDKTVIAMRDNDK